MSYERYEACARFLQSHISVAPKIGIILGSGLGGLVEEVEITEKISYTEIPDFPVSTVEGHSGYLIFGRLGGRDVVVMQGRHDWQTSYDLALAYFGKIDAPWKKWVAFPHAAHVLNLEQPGLSVVTLVNDVLPATRGEVPQGAERRAS